MGYQRLTRMERYQIAALKKSGTGVREIGRVLNRSPSTISGELLANSSWKGYDAQAADLQSKGRREVKCAKRQVVVSGEVKEYVTQKLLLDWSPEQISGRLLRERNLKLSSSTIYRFVYKDARSGGDLWTHLRTRRRKRKRQKRSILAENLNILKDIRPMRCRPKIVDEKTRVGDFERDLVVGTKPGGAILTINDRVSKRVKLAILKKKSADAVHQETLRLLKNSTVHTLTNDQGAEFARHKKTEKQLRAPIYFCRKACAWERGANENTNGLLRQYFPRCTDFSSITKAQINEAEHRLNTRPRKTLGYRTPEEVHQ
jgi:IS30 family transposase